jgi:Lon-like ATP-dependent protease
MVCSSIENVLTVLRRQLGVEPCNYDLHVNIPGGVPLDGPSAGITIATAVYSAILGCDTKMKPVYGWIDTTVAMPGEMSIRGLVHAVGGVEAKLLAAQQSGCRRVFIPRDNWQERFKLMEGLEVVPVETLEDVLKQVLLSPAQRQDTAGADVPKEAVTSPWQRLSPPAASHLPEQTQSW